MWLSHRGRRCPSFFVNKVYNGVIDCCFCFVKLVTCLADKLFLPYQTQYGGSNFEPGLTHDRVGAFHCFKVVGQLLLAVILHTRISYLYVE